jgi:hypothetical protein
VIQTVRRNRLRTFWVAVIGLTAICLLVFYVWLWQSFWTMPSVKKIVHSQLPLGTLRGRVEECAATNGWSYHYHTQRELPPETQARMITGMSRAIVDPAIVDFFARGQIMVEFFFDRNDCLIEVQFSSKIEGP